MKYELFVPKYLKHLNIWILWKKETGKDGRMTKVLYSLNYTGRASSTNPKTWASFKRLCDFTKTPEYSKYNGFGIVIPEESDLVFVDIDHCIDQDGELDERATDIVSHLHDNYIEISQSGSGLHIITRGSIPKNFNNHDLGVEMYGSKRFCAMTGKAYIIAEPTISQEAIDYVFEKYKTKERPKQTFTRSFSQCNRSDRDVIEKASSSTYFVPLYSGNWKGIYTSQSEADFRLCSILAFWTNCDRSAIDRIFRSSGLYRAKWEERDDYREGTITRAIDECKETINEYIDRRRREEARELERVLRKNNEI